MLVEVILIHYLVLNNREKMRVWICHMVEPLTSMRLLIQSSGPSTKRGGVEKMAQWIKYLLAL